MLMGLEIGLNNIQKTWQELYPTILATLLNTLSSVQSLVALGTTEAEIIAGDPPTKPSAGIKGI